MLLTVTKTVQDSTGEKLRVTTNRFKQNAALLKDVLQQQSDLAEANSRYQQAVLSFWTAKADLEKALGEE